jgi:ARG and Rhodanese-Phosphatase-superfamily-associated Protein domain
MKQTFTVVVTLVLFAAAIPIAILTMGQDGGPSSGGQDDKKTSVSEYRFSGPYTHENLTIFLIHGKNQLEGESFLTLQEAMEQKKVIVYETKDVNKLAIENLSHSDVYVQSGDIVKGGQQDRVLAVDLIVPPHSGKIPIAAFCVEQGRWSRRGSEQVGAFASSVEVVSTKDLKLAAKRSKSQGAVWENVRVAQDKLSSKVGTRVNSTTSESSLQLALENPRVTETSNAYIKALSDIVRDKSDVIGYAFAINGRVNSADVYASNQLFTKLWPKLLRANAVEAIAELQKNNHFLPVSEKQLKTFLRESETAKVDEKEVTARVGLLTREDDQNILFETRDRAKKGMWVHRNYIRK